MVATFQSTVRIDQTTGIVGDIIRQGPMRAQPAILNSTLPANNVIGRAFNYLNSVSDLDVTADVAGLFAGILVNSKVYATSGDGVGALNPTLVLPNETQVELLTMGIIIVDLSLASTSNPSTIIGSDIWAQDSTGILVGVASGLAGPASYTQVPNTVISLRNVDLIPGLAIITLTN
jgi:hypothetical protein